MFSVVFGLQPSVDGREKSATTAHSSGTLKPHRGQTVTRTLRVSAACAQFLQSNSLLRIDSATCRPLFALTSYQCSYGYEAVFSLVQGQLKPKDICFAMRDRTTHVRPIQSNTSDLILADFNLAVGWCIRQTDKFNSLPNFPAIRQLIDPLLIKRSLHNILSCCMPDSCY